MVDRYLRCCTSIDRPQDETRSILVLWVRTSANLRLKSILGVQITPSCVVLQDQAQKARPLRSGIVWIKRVRLVRINETYLEIYAKRTDTVIFGGCIVQGTRVKTSAPLVHK